MQRWQHNQIDVEHLHEQNPRGDVAELAPKVRQSANKGRLAKATLRRRMVNCGLPSLSCRTEKRRNNCDAMMKKPRKKAARRMKKFRFRYARLESRFASFPGAIFIHS